MARPGLAVRLLGCAWVAALGAGCASGMVALGPGRFEHPVRGYRIAAPAGDGWLRVHLDGADLAFRRGGARMSLQSTCGRPLAEPAILARHLLIGMGPREVLDAQPLQHGAHPGWAQTFVTRPQAKGAAVSAPAPLRGKTVTLIQGGCAFDWILLARDGFEAAEPVFDAWWQSFEGGAQP